MDYAIACYIQWWVEVCEKNSGCVREKHVNCSEESMILKGTVRVSNLFFSQPRWSAHTPLCLEIWGPFEMFTFVSESSKNVPRKFLVFSNRVGIDLANLQLPEHVRHGPVPAHRAKIVRAEPAVLAVH